MSTQLTPVLRTVGWALAHAVGSIRLGGTLWTLAVGVDGDRRTIYRYEARTIAESIVAAYDHLANQLGAGAHAALVHDGYVTSLEQPRTDAFLVEILGPGGSHRSRASTREFVSTRLAFAYSGWIASRPAPCYRSPYRAGR